MRLKLLRLTKTCNKTIETVLLIDDILLDNVKKVCDFMGFYGTVPCEPKLKAPELRVRYVVIKSVHFVHYRLFTQDPVGSVLLYYPRRGMTWQIGVKAWRE